eukprot:4315408-Pyramimonas_sp.AAC.1
MARYSLADLGSAQRLRKIETTPTTPALLRGHKSPGRTILRRGRLAVLSRSQDGLACVGTIVLLSPYCDMPPAQPRWH